MKLIEKFLYAFIGILVLSAVVSFMFSEIIFGISCLVFAASVILDDVRYNKIKKSNAYSIGKYVIQCVKNCGYCLAMETEDGLVLTASKDHKPDSDEKPNDKPDNPDENPTVTTETSSESPEVPAETQEEPTVTTPGSESPLNNLKA